MEKPRRRGGCCGCLTVLAVVALVLVVWVAAVQWGLLERLGLRQPVAERVLAGPPDREAAAQIMSMLRQGGTNIQGMDVQVLPMAGESGSVAIFTVDASQGFSLDRLFGGVGASEADDVFDEDALAELGITRLAFDYVNDEGKSIVTLTAPVEALKEAGESEDEQALLKALMGRVDIPALIQEVTP